MPKEKLTEENQDLVNLHSGLKMTEEILMNTLKRHGMEKFDPSIEAEPFNPNKHEATFQTPQPDKKDGTVFFTQQKGFLYNGRVLRVSSERGGFSSRTVTNFSGRRQRLVLSRIHDRTELAVVSLNELL